MKFLAGYFLFVVLIFSFISVVGKKDPPAWKATEGAYALELVSSSGYVLPLGVFLNPQWGYYACITEKSNMVRRISGFLKVPNVQVTCARWYLGEI